MVNNKGWIRIVEVSIAILLISAVVIIIFQSNRVEFEKDVTGIMSVSLEEAAKNTVLRERILSYDPSSDMNSGENKLILAELDLFLRARIAPVYNFTVRICPIDNICSLETYPSTSELNIYTDERIISTSATQTTTFDPKKDSRKVKIFLWYSR